jgi:hypothetical protein
MDNSPFGTVSDVVFNFRPAIILLLIPFVIIFVWASIKEYQRWRRFGPSMNKRGAYDIDESAPGYEAPTDDNDTQDETK